MHELSLAVDVIGLASDEAAKNRMSNIQEILIEVGALSGVEADAFEWALALAVKDTMLEKAARQIIRTPGMGSCNRCGIDFEMRQILDACPECGGCPSEIKGGREFRLVSITGE